MLTLKARDLKLADVVQVFDGAFGTAVVCQIEDGMIHLERPYMHTADFSCTSGVMTYIGMERFKVLINSNVTFPVLDRKNLR